MAIALGTAGTPTRHARCARRGWLLAALVLVTLLALGPGSGSAQASDRVVTQRVERSPAQVRDFWTPQRMRAAKPAERVVDRIREAVGLPGAGDRGRPSVVAPSPPGGAEPRAGLLDGVLGGLSGGEQASTQSAAAQVGSSGAYPSRTHGKVFFRIPGRGSFVCSGTVVRSPGRSVVVTAGHCVYDEIVGRFATDWMFVPGYRDGSRPYGTWVAARLATTSQFRSSGSLRYDVGIAVMRRNSNGRGIQDRVGARGIAFNQPRNQVYRAFGYPARGEFDGRRLYRCDSPYEGADRSFPPPRPLRIDCDMTAGSSGGGWVVGNRFVTSLVSYAYECTPALLFPCESSEEGKLFGPYFGNAVRALYRTNRGRARRCGGELVTHWGARGQDRLAGTRSADVIHGGAGRDLLRGRGGNDVICAGPGHDRVITGPGRNRVIAPRGGNRIRCGRGRDVVITNRRSRVSSECNVVRRR